MAGILSPKAIKNLAQSLVNRSMDAVTKGQAAGAKGTIEAELLLDGDFVEDINGNVTFRGQVKTLPLPQVPGGSIGAGFSRRWERTANGSVLYAIRIVLEL